MIRPSRKWRLCSAYSHSTLPFNLGANIMSGFLVTISNITWRRRDWPGGPQSECCPSKTSYSSTTRGDRDTIRRAHLGVRVGAQVAVEEGLAALEASAQLLGVGQVAVVDEVHAQRGVDEERLCLLRRWWAGCRVAHMPNAHIAWTGQVWTKWRTISRFSKIRLGVDMTARRWSACCQVAHIAWPKPLNAQKRDQTRCRYKHCRTICSFAPVGGKVAKFEPCRLPPAFGPSAKTAHAAACVS